MDSTENRLPHPDDGRSPSDLTKKELVAHLHASSDIPNWKLNVMSREAILALFALPLDEALAAVAAAGREHGRKHRQPKREETAVFEHYLTGSVRRE